MSAVRGDTEGPPDSAWPRAGVGMRRPDATNRSGADHRVGAAKENNKHRLLGRAGEGRHNACHNTTARLWPTFPDRTR